MTKTEAKKKIQDLVEKYESVKKTGQIRSYSEDDTITGFVLPLFTILGWDISNKEEVSAQEHIKGVGRSDRTFKINGITQFYLEAKKLSADLDDEKFTTQAINYSWNKGVTYAILTDFEAVKVFNAERINKIDLIDKLIFEIPYTKFIGDFDRLWLLSKEAFTDKKLNSYAEEHGKKEKSFTVVSVIKKLNEDIQWSRERLTQAFEDCNQKKKISKDLLDEGVQKLLDRLIFLRVAEDRDVEPNILKNLLREAELSKGSTPFQAMVSTFRDLDKIYNSNLFSEHPFEKWEEWSGALKEVIERLYGKRGHYQYNFKEMPADVLGSVYENYLGYKLSTAKSKNKNLFGDDGREIKIHKDVKKRKEQGIYYTPLFIVDYIVRNALKPILDKCESIYDLKKIKILDPACGSGSFLVKALEAIAEKYKDFNAYHENTKRQIILENLYGVDLDMQAVEIAQLNLSINSLDTKDILPSFDKNIKMGNSLKDFSWQEEFPDVFRQGGFDVIIGNPPYIKEFVNKSAFNGLHDSPYYEGKMDIWTMFGCISIDLLKNGGVLSFIAPNNWVSNAGASIFRSKILKDGELKTFIDFGDYKVFEQAGIQTMIFIFEKKKPRDKYDVEYLKISDKNIAPDKLVIDIFGEKQKIKIEPEKLIDKNITFSAERSNSIFEKLESKKNFELKENEVAQGIVGAPDKYFIIKNIAEFNKDEKIFLKLFYTSTKRFIESDSNSYIFYLSSKNFENKSLDNFPNIKNYFEPHKKALQAAKVKYGTPNKPYFYLHREREEIFFQKGPKVAGSTRTAFPSFLYTEEEYYGSRAMNFIKTDRINLKYLTGLLNSRISYFWLKNKGKQLGDLLQIDKGPLLDIPIYIGDKKQQKEIIVLVDKMLSLQKQFHDTPENSNKWNQLKSDIEKIDKKIDKAVYKLYGFTTEEIKIVENS